MLSLSLRLISATLYFSLAFSQASAQEACIDLFRLSSQSEDLSFDAATSSPEKLHEYRMSHLENDGTKALIVNGLSYTVIGQLGRASYNVYLARTSSGKLVVVKESLPGIRSTAFQTYLAMAYHEFVQPLFFREHNVLVPRVLDIEIQSNTIFVVKEYYEGLNYDEVLKTLFLSDSLRKKLLADLDGEIKYLKYDIFGQDRPNPAHTTKIPGTKLFRRWIEQNGIQLDSRFAVLSAIKYALDLSDKKNRTLFESKLDEGDLKPQNFIWSTAHQKWILIDP